MAQAEFGFGKCGGQIALDFRGVVGRGKTQPAGDAAAVLEARLQFGHRRLRRRQGGLGRGDLDLEGAGLDDEERLY